MNAPIEHTTAHVRVGIADFLSGCTCGWIGTPRSTLQAAVADCITHCRPFVPQVQRCTDACCPIDSRPPLAEELHRHNNGGQA